MKYMVFLTTLILSSAAFAEKAPPRAESKSRITNGCMKMMPQVSADTKKKICDCILKKLDSKLSDAALGILALEYENPGPDGVTESSLMTFDRHVGMECYEKFGPSREANSVKPQAPAGKEKK